MTIANGTKLGRYEIRSKIGAGGMGEVYLAQDTKLDRQVALKILPADVAADRNRMSRFVQEAKAASALNHPNIITIHEIEQIDSVNFIATEFIDGETLRERMRNAPMKLGDVLEVAAQIANALAAAHATNIVHRDIKPENVMVRRDGIVKVVDFGLAKLSEPPAVAGGPAIDTEAPTRANVKTEPGVVMGTVAYMSPEQARGLIVDARTDIFSLGVVLYEMVAGCLPFEGSTKSDLLASILSEKEPQPLARYAREAPAELERIVSKALRKNRDERYQTSKDLLLDLGSLKQQSEFDRKLERSSPPQSQPAEITGDNSQTATIGQAAARSTVGRPGLTKLTNRNTIIAFGCLLVVASAIGAYFYFTHAFKGPINSVAILPFVNVSNDPNTEYLSDGISESLINNLSQLPQLKIIARSSSFKYKGKEADPQEVAKALGVQAVVTGRVAQRGDQLIVSVELVDARDRTQMWGEQYQRPVADLLAVQREIAKEITGNLRLRLSEAQQQMTNRSAGNAQAYELYLKGHYYMNTLTDEGTKKGLGYFQQAIETDSNYAPAYAGLAESYAQLAGSGVIPSKEAIAKAKAAALKALELDDALAEAHTALGLIALSSEWDWNGAEREFKRAIALNPNYVNARHWYSHYLITMGRIEESLAESKKALELDPLDVAMNFHLGWHYFYARQYDQAIAQLQRTLGMDRNSDAAHCILGWVYEQKGQFDEAIAELKKSMELGGGDQRGSIGHVYAISGRRGEAQKLLDQLREESRQKYVSPYNIATIYEGLGEKDQAFAWLEKSYAARESSMASLKVDPEFASLRSDPRFTDLLRRMGLKP
jgi:serine/threonine protein kinase/lipoprotein NlpI